MRSAVSPFAHRSRAIGKQNYGAKTLWTVDLITVQYLLGHAKIAMTGHYAHSLADDKIAAVRRLDRALFAAPADANRTPEVISAEVAEGSKALSANALGL